MMALNYILFLVVPTIIRADPALAAEATPITNENNNAHAHIPGNDASVDTSNCDPNDSACTNAVNNPSDVVNNHDCTGYFTQWTPCQRSFQERSYFVTKGAEDGGKPCPFPSGHVETNDNCGVACVGSFVPQTATCDAQNEQKHRYTITQAAREGGKPCTDPHKGQDIEDGTEQSWPCVNCAGAFSGWTTCHNGERTVISVIIVNMSN